MNGPVGERETGNTAQDAVVSLLRVAGRVQQGLSDICAGHGITHDQYNVLRILRGVHPEGHPRFEISQRLISRAPDVTRLLDRLERGGLIERVTSAEDRRLSLSKITENGLALLQRVDPAVLAVHESVATGLSENEKEELGRLCRLMLLQA